MITSGEWLNPTRAAGFLAYGAATVCCLIAWLRSSNRRDRRLLRVLTIVEFMLLLDIAFNWRWMVHDLGVTFALSTHEYDMRRTPQSIVVILLGMVFILGVFTAIHRLRGRPGALLAVTGTFSSLVLWCVEAVSLHAADHVLYHLISRWMFVSVLWIVCCAMTAAGALLVSQRTHRP